MKKIGFDHFPREMAVEQALVEWRVESGEWRGERGEGREYCILSNLMEIGRRILLGQHAHASVGMAPRMTPRMAPRMAPCTLHPANLTFIYPILPRLLCVLRVSVVPNSFFISLGESGIQAGESA
jgi:hypothetical protein